MAWVRIDDHFDEHPKLQQVGPLGWGVWMAGLAYCNRNLTDGFIPWTKARTLVSFDVAEEDGAVWTLSRTSGMSGEDIDAHWVIDLLVSAGLWDVVHNERGRIDGYRIHDYTDYQPSRAQIEEERARTAKRQEAWRERHKQQSNAVTPPASNDERNGVTNEKSNAVTNGPVTMAPNPNPNPRTGDLSSPEKKKNNYGQRRAKNAAIANPDSLDADFEARFYGPYPRHVKRDEALKAWVKLSEGERADAAAGLARWFDAGAFSPDVSFVPYPATWLNQRRWSDDVRAVNPPKAAAAANGFTLDDEREYRRNNPLLRVVEP